MGWRRVAPHVASRRRRRRTSWLALLAVAVAVPALPAGAAGDNDNFQTPRTMNPLPYVSQFDIGPATREPGEPVGSCGPGPGDATVWFRFTPPQDMGLLVELKAGFRSTMVLYTGSALSSLTEVACDTRGTYYWSGRKYEYEIGTLQVGLRAGVEYFLQIEEDPGSYARHNIGELSVREAQWPPDLIAEAAPLPQDLSAVSGFTGNATEEPGEPAACSSTAENTWWYRIAATNADAMKLTLSANFPAAVAVYVRMADGTPGAALGCGGKWLRPSAGSELLVQITSSTSPSAGGTFTLSGAWAPIPPNDDAANAILVPLGEETVTLSAAPANFEAGELPPSCLGGTPTGSLWWRVDADVRTTLTLTALESYTQAVAIRTGSPSADESACVALSGNPREIHVAVPAGTSYAQFAFSGDGKETRFKTFSGHTPPHDDRAFAKPVVGSIAETVDLRTATSEPGEGGGASVWYSFTAPEDGGVFMSTTVGWVTLFDAATLEVLGASWMGIWTKDGRSWLPISAGRDYLVKASQAYRWFTDISIDVTDRPPPETPDTATPILALPYEEDVVFTAAKREEGDRTPACAEKALKTFWFTITLPATTPIIVDTDGSSMPHVLALFDEHPAGRDERLCRASPLSPPETTLAFTAEAGRTYWLMFASECKECFHHIALAVRELFPPPNDSIAAAAPIAAVPETLQADLTGAGLEPSEPDACGNMGHTAWYSLEAAETFGVLALPRGVRPHIGVYQGSASGALVACVDTATPEAFRVDAGERYLLQVGLEEGAGAPVSLDLSRTAVAGNDDMAAARDVERMPFADETHNTTATLETGEPDACALIPGATPIRATIWYRYEATETAPLAAWTYGSAADTVLAVYRDAVGPDTMLGCAGDDAGRDDATVGFTAEAGHTYLFQVGSQDGRTSGIVFEIGPGAAARAARDSGPTVSAGAGVGGQTAGASFEIAFPWYYPHPLGGRFGTRAHVGRP